MPTTPSDHPWLDGDAFREDLQELAALGFLPIADYSVVYPGAPRGFARVFVDPGRRVFAEVNQRRPGATVLPGATTFESVLTDGWSLQSTTREPMSSALTVGGSVASTVNESPGTIALVDTLVPVTGLT